MDTENREDLESRLDHATAQRLRRLGSMPVDLSRLEQRVAQEIPRPGKASLMVIWLRPMRAAAGLVAAAILALVLLSNPGGPVLASPAQMAKLHEDLVSGRAEVVQVDSIDAANKALLAQWPQSPSIPAVPAEHVMACCMKSLKNKKMACVLLRNEGVPVTLTVANAADMRLPQSPTVSRDGLICHVQSNGSLKMVMTQRDGRWICLMGEAPVERLLEIAARLKF